MATFNSVNFFARNLAYGIHDFRATSTTLKIALSNSAPVASTTDTLATAAEISATNGGYTAGGLDVANVASTAGAWTAATDTMKVLSATGVSWTASSAGGAFPSFRYVILYDDTQASDAILGWWDYGSQVALSTGDQFIVDFGASLFTINV